MVQLLLLFPLVASLQFKTQDGNSKMTHNYLLLDNLQEFLKDIVRDEEAVSH